MQVKSNSRCLSLVLVLGIADCMCRFEGRFVDMIGCKRDVVAWMEVSGGDSQLETRSRHQVVDDVGNLSATFDCQGAVRFAEVLLHVDDGEGRFAGW